MSAPTILWFRRDLRLADQAALIAAAKAGPVVPVYVLDDVPPVIGAWAGHRAGGFITVFRRWRPT